MTPMAPTTTRPPHFHPSSHGRSILLVALAAVLLGGCASDQSQWYKGNTHAHTVLCGHADSSPEAVAGWYLDHGFNFLILSEHNIYIEPSSVALPPDRRDDFILIPGEEISGKKTIHTTGMNLDSLVDASFDSEHKSEIIQNHTDGAIDAGGVAILNHPNFGWAVEPEDMLPVERLHMFELYNGHPAVHNQGDADHLSTEALWDVLLSAGKVIYGVSSDDMHNLKNWGTEVSNPGRGWVMVRADELTPDAITGAMARGDFYASSGVILKDVVAGEPYRSGEATFYAVEVDVAATMKELESDMLVGNRVRDAAEGFTIEWIGQNGVVLSAVHATSAVRRVEPQMKYLRCKVTYARRVEPGEGDGEGAGPMYEAFYAWTQPVFTDGRLDRFASTMEVAFVSQTHEHGDDGAHNDAGFEEGGHVHGGDR
jgi:hypothetical protein